jgi:hypothetical protein
VHANLKDMNKSVSDGKSRGGGERKGETHLGGYMRNGCTVSKYPSPGYMRNGCTVSKYPSPGYMRNGCTIA